MAASLRSAASTATALLLLGACAPSSDELAGQVAGEPGVLGVRVTEEDVADDDLPLGDPPRRVDVRVAADASAAQVRAVFDAYAEAVEDGHLVSVTVALDGPRDVVLATGEGVRVTGDAVEDLVDAHRDEDVLAYRREAYPVLPGVSVDLVPSAGLDGVLAWAHRYDDAADVDLVAAEAGAFLLVRDSVNEDLRVTSAREALALRVDDSVGLRGARIGGRGPLELVVATDDVAAARRLVARAPEGALLKRVVVTS
ncbi:hypothetical protein QWY28_13500 [Nocardioides sp. SOB77]|uniref:Uncharacterized protein n=1 Tax=Nocardioides oceani TaxID=3058369 RepID=A0ABT8FH00_9ACTN|nr:hypothetical protein [Nocardioides oceani]MDN4173971.1 hypothetical protein [Nocardioides oceani]